MSSEVEERQQTGAEASTLHRPKSPSMVATETTPLLIPKSKNRRSSLSDLGEEYLTLSVSYDTSTTSKTDGRVRGPSSLFEEPGNRAEEEAYDFSIETDDQGMQSDPFEYDNSPEYRAILGGCTSAAYVYDTYRSVDEVDISRHYVAFRSQLDVERMFASPDMAKIFRS